MISTTFYQTYLFQQDYSEWPIYTLPHCSEWLSPVIEELQPLLNLNSLAAFCLWDLQSQYCSTICKWNAQNQKQEKKETTVNPKMNKDQTRLQLKCNEILNQLQHFIWDPSMILVHSKKKSERKANSIRRSNFIGVSRNGPNWQSIISMKKNKFYLGTYSTQKDAAMVFDFYSIMIHGLEAKTNFSYSKDWIVNMIAEYKENGKVYIP